ncbi:MAG: hypothetical protein HOC74_05975 [Gemmatimonadetes bacterium]|jgi:trimethylamine---corrinoid protein Co-methyltransferase|nr:hypothetical protein [Gemmatimonadota bacterium]
MNCGKSRAMITPEQVDDVFGVACRLLETEGIQVESERVADLLGSFKGVEVGGPGERVKIPTHLVEESLEGARQWDRTLFDRSGEKAFPLEGGGFFDPGSCAIHVRDYQTGVRPGETRDLVRFCRVADYLDDVDLQSTAFVSHDVPREVQDCYRLYVVLVSSGKPIVTGTFGREGYGPMRDMLLAVRGGEEELRAKPLAIFDCAPSAPLKWSGFLSEDIVDCARLGIPVEFVSMPVPGTLAPVYLYDALIQHTAESLSGIVISQCAQKGAPIIYGGSPMSWDFRMTHCIATPDVMKLDAAYAQVGHKLGLATHAYLGLTDANFVDYQAGAESLFGILVALQSGIDVISGLGMIAQESLQSIEKLVLDAEMARRARHFVRGIREREFNPEVWTALFQGNIMRHESTMRDFREEILLPRVMTGEAIETEDALAAAHGEVERILMKHHPEPVEESLHGELRAIMETQVRRYGMRELPALD